MRLVQERAAPHLRASTFAISRSRIVRITEGPLAWTKWHRIEGAPWIHAWVGPDGLERQLVLDVGFLTDLSSVPKIVWWWIAPVDLKDACLPHDLIYRYAGHVPPMYFLIDGEPCDEPWTRKQADRFFARRMAESGVPIIKRRAAYLAVRMGGWRPWRKNRPHVEREIAASVSVSR